MSPRPRYTRRDNNHTEIRDQLRELGAAVVDVADLGGECGDLVVSWRGRTVHVEIKDEGKRTDLTKGERKFKAHLERVGCQLVVAETVEEVIRAFERDDI